MGNVIDFSGNASDDRKSEAYDLIIQFKDVFAEPDELERLKKEARMCSLIQLYLVKYFREEMGY